LKNNPANCILIRFETTETYTFMKSVAATKAEQQQQQQQQQDQ